MTESHVDGPVRTSMESMEGERIEIRIPHEDEGNPYPEGLDDHVRFCPAGHRLRVQRQNSQGRRLSLRRTSIKHGLIPAVAVRRKSCVSFEDVLAEPEGAHSFDCVWTISKAMFNCWKLFCYRLHTLCYGICLAAEWGYLAALTAFYHIWTVTPLFKLLEINCACVKMFYGMFVHCCLDPMFEACGNLFFVFKKR